MTTTTTTPTTCPTCDGKGTRTYYRYQGGDSYADEVDDCYQCDGSGVVA